MPISRSRQLEISRRRQRSLEMAIAGATTRQIAQSLSQQGENISHVQVAKDIKIALGELSDGNRNGADTLRALFNQRYERMIMRIWNTAMGRPAQRNAQGEVTQGEVPPDEDTMDRVVRIMAEMRRLNGLDVIPEVGTEENPMHMSIVELAKAYQENGYSRAEDSHRGAPEPRVLSEGNSGG